MPELAQGHDVLVVDFLMMLAIPAAAKLPQPVAVLLHTAAGAMKPTPMQAHMLTALNAIRRANGLPESGGPLDLPAEVRAVLVATLPEIDEYSAQASPTWHWVGPVPGPAAESLDEKLFDDGDPRPLILVGLTTHSSWGPQTDRLQRSSRLSPPLKSVSWQRAVRPLTCLPCGCPQTPWYGKPCRIEP